MHYNKNNLNVAKIAAKDDLRPALSSVFFKDNMTVATDAYRLIEMSVPTDGEFKALEGHAAMQGCKPFLVSAKSIKEIKSPLLAIKHVDDKQVQFLTSESVLHYNRVDEQFPDYERIIPTGDPVAEVRVNAQFLSELLDILGKLDDGMHAVTIKLYGGEKPMLIEAGGDKQHGRGILMPIHE